MGVKLTVTNLYDNGVCSDYGIYTATTYNGDPYLIPNSATFLGEQTLPYEFTVNNINSGPIYIFVEHCDDHITPPPNDTPKRQGGFQVKMITVDCGPECPIGPTSTPNPTAYPTGTPQPTPQSTPNPTASETPQPTPNATNEATPNPTNQPTETPAPSSTPNATPNPTPSPSPSVTPIQGFGPTPSPTTPAETRL